MACLVILRHPRMGHPRVVIRYVVNVWRRWSFFDTFDCTVLYFSKKFNLEVVYGFNIR